MLLLLLLLLAIWTAAGCCHAQPATAGPDHAAQCHLHGVLQPRIPSMANIAHNIDIASCHAPQHCGKILKQ